jgi:hypothetical protein
MKHAFLLVLTIVALTLGAGAQPVQMQVIIRSPAPGALPVWASDPSIVQIILQNPTATHYDGAIISFEIRRLPGAQIVVRSKDFHPLQPRLSIPPNGSLVLSGPQIINEGALKFEDESLRQQAQATGQLPEGEYEFCARLLDATGRLIGTTGAYCPRTTVLLPDPPMLIHPRNDSTLSPGSLPLFIWAPVTGSLVPVTYSLYVVPLFPGQAPQDALRSNPPVLSLRGLLSPIYQYLPTDIPFSAFPQAVGYVWQVEALGPDGRPATRNNGRSEIFRFRFADTRSSLIPSDSGRSGTTPVRSDTTITTHGAQAGSADSTALISKIALPGGFSIVLRSTNACSTSSCTISGSGSLYIPLLDDSVEVMLSGITVSRPDGHGVARLVSGRFHVPVGAMKQFGLLSLHLRQLDVSPVTVILDGVWRTRWSDWDWSCRTSDSVEFQVPFETNGFTLPNLRLPVPWQCSGDGLLIGQCIGLRFDSLNTALSVDTSYKPPIVTAYLFGIGQVELPCLVAGGQPVRGTIRIRLDRGKHDLLAFLTNSLRNVRVLGSGALTFDADTVVLDFSSQVNDSSFPPREVCSNPAWSDPQWRGVFVPSMHMNVVIGDDTLRMMTRAIFDQGSGRKHALTFVAQSFSNMTVEVGGFRIRLDSATVRVCQGILQHVSARGMLIMPTSLQRPSNWTALDSIRVRLIGFDDGTRWLWNATLDISSGLRLRFGSLAELVLRNGTIEIVDPPQGNRRGYVEFSHLQLSAPSHHPTGTADFYGLRIWNTGEVELESADGWMDLSRWAGLSVANLTIQAQEIGLGYSHRAGSGSHWWIGFSGGFELGAETALPTGENGIRVRRLRIWDDEFVTSEGAFVNARIAGAFRLAGNLQWGDTLLGGVPIRGLLGQLTGQFDCIGGMQAQVDFALGSTTGPSPFRYWFIRGGAAVPGGVPVVPGAFHLVGGLFGAGWHVRLDGYRGTLFSDVGGLASHPTLTPDNSRDLLLQGGFIFADPALQLYRLSATTSLAFGSSTQVALDGSIAVLPQIHLAAGTFWAQYLHSSRNRTVSLGGNVSVNFLNTEVFSSSVSASFGSGGSSCLTLGPYSGEWIVADLDETVGSDIFGVNVSAKGFLTINRLYARLCPTQGELFGSLRGAGVVGMHLYVGPVQLPHHIGLSIGSEFCGRYLYKFWYDRNTNRFNLSTRSGGACTLSMNFDYSGYPYGHYTQAYDHVRGHSYSGGDFVRLDRHWNACNGSHCKQVGVDLRLQGLFQVDASIGTVPLRVGSTEVRLPLLSSTRASVDVGYYGWARYGTKVGAKRGGALGAQAETLTCTNLDSWGENAATSNRNQIPPPRLVLSSLPAHGESNVPITTCITIRTGARLWAYGGCDRSTRCWKCSTLRATLQQLDASGLPVRSVPLGQEPSSPPLEGSDTIRYCITPTPSYPWQTLLPATRYRIVLDGMLESTDGQSVPSLDTLEFSTAPRLDHLWLEARLSWTQTLPRILSTALDTLIIAYPLSPRALLAPLQFGRDLWLEIEAGQQRWLWSGNPNALIRSSEDLVVLGNYLGSSFHLDTSLLQPQVIGTRPFPFPITIRVVNALVEGSSQARPTEADVFLRALPRIVAEFHTEYAPTGTTQLSTALRWIAPSLPANAGIAGETTSGSSPIALQLSLQNHGSTGIFSGTPFELSVGAYIELPDRSRQYIVERHQYHLRSFVAPGEEERIEHTLFFPTGTRVLGIRAHVLPLPPFFEQDGTTNNSISQGELPPLGELER